MTRRVRIRAAATATTRLVVMEAQGDFDAAALALFTEAMTFVSQRPPEGVTRLLDYARDEPPAPKRIRRRRP